MKIESLMKRLAAVLAVAGGLTLAGLAQAQDIYYWYAFYPPWQPHSSLYPNWNSYLTNTAAVNFNTVFAFTNAVLDEPASGLEVTSTIGGYGSGYADLNSGVGVIFANGDLVLATNDITCTLAFTVNPTPGMVASGSSFYTNYNWIGLVFILNLDSGIYTLANNPPGNNYSGWNNPGNPSNYQWNGSNVTMTVNLSSLPKFLAYTQGGTNHFYGCNIGIDPSVIFNDPVGELRFSSLRYYVQLHHLCRGRNAATEPVHQPGRYQRHRLLARERYLHLATKRQYGEIQLVALGFSTQLEQREFQYQHPGAHEHLVFPLEQSLTAPGA